MTINEHSDINFLGMSAAVVVALLPLGGGAFAAEPKVTCSTTESAQFDFWIGEWEVVFTSDSKPAGHSLVEKLYGGCALRENWTGNSGYSGGSLNFYDRSSAKWRQTWVGSDGIATDYVGGLEGSALVFRASQLSESLGRPVLMRMTFTPIGNNEVRQQIELSEDGGGSWRSEYDLTYRRIHSDRATGK